MNNSTPYWMWMQQAVGQGSSVVPTLLEAFESPQAVYAASRLELERAGVTGQPLDCLCRKSLDAMQRMAERCAKMGWILTPEDAAYPEPLRHIFSPPLVLYGKGLLPDMGVETIPTICMVGTRKFTDYGKQVAGGIAAGLAAAGCVVVSGGAKGIDAASHQGALYGGGRTVVVQACGLDIEYPLPNRYLRQQVVENGGAVITEYLPGVPAYRNHFRVRNRLMSGLSWGVCVVEAPERSGALITARHARTQGRDVFVVPGNITSPNSFGCNKLIQEGAQLITRPGDILAEYQLRCGGRLDEEEADRAQIAYYERPNMPMSSMVRVADNRPHLKTACPDAATDDAKCVYAALSEQPTTAEELCHTTGLAAGRLFAALTELELYGSARSYPGKRYSR